MNIYDDSLSYQSVYGLRDTFRKAGGVSDTSTGSLFNRTDSPGTFYFRIFFYFNDGRLLDLSRDVDSILKDGGIGTTVSNIQNTAINYLLLNNEFERAEILETFVSLLSNINTYSPWYFQKISGLDTAMQRDEFTEDAKMNSEPKKISITCLTDAYDQRIGTLLDAYRAACFSHRLHKEIVPANLRKFDMAVYLFSTPIANMHGQRDVKNRSREWDNWTSSQGDASFRHNKNTTDYITSSKLLEFKNCEIDINSSTSSYSDLSNADGHQFEYTIDINFDDVVEQRYNEFLMRYIGDLIAWDIDYSRTSEEYKQDLEEIESRRVEQRASMESRLDSLNNRSDDEVETLSIGDSRGSIQIPGTLQKYGMRSEGVLEKAASRITSKVSNVVKRAIREYDPISNLDRLMSNTSSTISRYIDKEAYNIARKITFGNIFNSNTTLSRKVDNISNGLADKLGVSTPNINNNKVRTNIYKGWLRDSSK